MATRRSRTKVGSKSSTQADLPAANDVLDAAAPSPLLAAPPASELAVAPLDELALVDAAWDELFV